MLKKLNQEIVVRRTMLMILIDSLITGIALTVILYFCLTDFNEGIVEFLKSVAENNLETTATLILFPILLIFTFIINISTVLTNTDTKTTKKSKKK